MEIIDHICEIFKNRRDGIFFEIGAHWGTDTIHNLDKVGNSLKRYVAFEPDTRNIAIFKKNVTDPKVTLIEMAIGNQDGYIDLYLSSGRPADISDPAYNHTHSNSIKKPKNHLKAHPWCKFDAKARVPIARLDSICPSLNIDHIDFIWCDIQGAECDMIMGGQSTLMHTDFVLMEYSNRELYEGEMPLDRLLKLMPGKWQIIEQYSHDVLIRKV